MNNLPVLSRVYAHSKISESMFVTSYFALSPNADSLTNFCFVTLVYLVDPYYLIRTINWGASADYEDDYQLIDRALIGHSRCVKALRKAYDFIDANLISTPFLELLEQGRIKQEEALLAQHKPSNS